MYFTKILYYRYLFTYNLKLITCYGQHCEVCDSEGVDRRVQMIYICLVSNLPANKSSAARAAPSPDPASTSSRPNRTSETTYWVRFALT